MDKKIEFGFWETVFFLVNLVSIKALLIHPMLISKAGGSAAILLSIYISLIGFAFTSLLLLLYNKFKGLSFVEIIRIKFGKVVFVIVSLIFLLMYVLNTGLALRNVCENIKMIFFRNSPVVLVFIYVFIAMCAGAYIGLKGIIRLHTIIIPILLLLFLTIFFSVFGSYKFNNIFPILGKGLPMFHYGFIFSSYFADIIAVFILSKYIKKDISISKICFTAQGISALILVITVSIYVLILPYPASSDFFMPLYQIERFLEHKTILSRLEAVFSGLWCTSFFLYLSTALIIACKLFSKIFSKPKAENIIIPIAFLSSCIAWCPESTLEVAQITENNMYIKLIIGFIVPIVLLIIAHFRRENY